MYHQVGLRVFSVAAPADLLLIRPAGALLLSTSHLMSQRGHRAFLAVHCSCGFSVLTQEAPETSVPSQVQELYKLWPLRPGTFASIKDGDRIRRETPCCSSQTLATADSDSGHQPFTKAPNVA